MIVRGLIINPVDGMSTPNALSIARKATARPMPTPRPAPDATTPITSDSPSTEPTTCGRLAPTARSNANSRNRCATMIENVLKIRNEPTNNAMRAKISRNVLKKPSASCTAFCPSCVICLPVSTSSFGSDSAARSR